jgi:hypothetical protein
MTRPARTYSRSTAALAGVGRAAVNARRVPLALLLVLVLLGSAGGCTARLVYDRLDTFAAWYVEDYVDLQGPQRDELRAVLQRQLDWHRSTQLPVYADALTRLQADAARPLGRARVESARAELEEYWRDAVRNGLGDATTFLQRLSDEQIDGMFEEFAREDAKLAKKQASRTPERRLQERTKRVVRSLERWTGPLDEAQRRRVTAGLAAAVPLDAEWLANRQRWREQFRSALARRAEGATFRAEVERLFLKPETAWTAEYRAAIDRNGETYGAMIADLDASLTPKQRAHLRERLGEWAADLRALHAART